MICCWAQIDPHHQHYRGNSECWGGLDIHSTARRLTTTKLKMCDVGVLSSGAMSACYRLSPTAEEHRWRVHEESLENTDSPLAVGGFHGYPLEGGG